MRKHLVGRRFGVGLLLVGAVAGAWASSVVPGSGSRAVNRVEHRRLAIVLVAVHATFGGDLVRVGDLFEGYRPGVRGASVQRDGALVVWNSSRVRPK